ncbi:hypothetical protein ILUMI_09208, partial [Ignelater luminosus]
EVFIAPPEPAVLTDEDSGDDDKGGDFNNLSRRQLLADADVRAVCERDTDETCVYPKSSDSRTWIVGDFKPHDRQFPMLDYSEFQNKCVTDFFEIQMDMVVQERYGKIDCLETVLLHKKNLLKKDRGYYESTISKADGVLIAKWLDNSVVCIATNAFGIEPVTKTHNGESTLSIVVRICFFLAVMG